MQEEHPFVTLARETVEQYTIDGNVKSPPEPLPDIFEREAGVFVSIKKNGELRGCIGTTQATGENIAREIIRNAISAAHRDPRFPPVREDELDQLEYSVDVLSEAERIESTEELDPEKYGVIVEKGFRRGLLLPRLEGIDTVEKQVDIARRKAGISQGADITLYRFQVERYK